MRKETLVGKPHRGFKFIAHTDCYDASQPGAEQVALNKLAELLSTLTGMNSFHPHGFKVHFRSRNAGSPRAVLSVGQHLPTRVYEHVKTVAKTLKTLPMKTLSLTAYPVRAKWWGKKARRRAMEHTYA